MVYYFPWTNHPVLCGGKQPHNGKELTIGAACPLGGDFPFSNISGHGNWLRASLQLAALESHTKAVSLSAL